MRKITFIILILSAKFTCFCQSSKILPVDSATGLILFKKITQLDTCFKSDKIYRLIHDWVSTNPDKFRRDNNVNFTGGDLLIGDRRPTAIIDNLHKNENPVQSINKEDKQIITNVVYKYVGGTFSCIRILYIHYGLIIQCKDGKYQIKATNFTYTHYNQVKLVEEPLKIPQDGPCKSKGNMEDLLKCDKCDKSLPEMYTELSNNTKTLMNDLIKYMNTEKCKGSDW